MFFFYLTFCVSALELVLTDEKKKKVIFFFSFFPLHALCTHYCLFVSCNLDKWYNIKRKVVESQAVGRRMRANRSVPVCAGAAGAPTAPPHNPPPRMRTNALKTSGLYFGSLGFLAHSVLWISCCCVTAVRGGRGRAGLSFSPILKSNDFWSHYHVCLFFFFSFLSPLNKEGSF